MTGNIIAAMKIDDGRCDGEQTRRPAETAARDGWTVSAEQTGPFGAGSW